jgi:hypothetical protein
MPFNGGGTFSRPVSAYVFDTVISETDVNSEMDGIATGLSTVIAKDGQTTTTARIPFASGIYSDTVAELTTATGVTVDGVLLKDGRIDTTQGADIASASTVNLETATGNVVDVTGTTTITAITLSQGHWRWVRFTGILTLTHGSSLVLPGAANITTAAGDYALFMGYGSSVVRCAYYVTVAGVAAAGPASATDSAVALFDGTTGKLLKDSATTVSSIKAIDQQSKSAAYTTVLGDAGKHIYHPSSDNNARTFTIDSNANVAYPVGTAITFVNEINTVTIAITSDTLTLCSAGTTGSRTLAANGIATALKVASTKWVISGVGLT